MSILQAIQPPQWSKNLSHKTPRISVTSTGFTSRMLLKGQRNGIHPSHSPTKKKTTSGCASGQSFRRPAGFGRVYITPPPPRSLFQEFFAPEKGAPRIPKRVWRIFHIKKTSWLAGVLTRLRATSLGKKNPQRVLAIQLQVKERTDHLNCKKKQAI